MYHGLDYIRHLDARGRESSYPVLVMEYAEGGTLTDFLKTHPDDGVRDKLIRDIIQGIGYLHGEGILHRDLKPGNILITKNRRGEPVARITDFGISRDLLTDKTLEQSYTEGIGTPHYMAPEQFFKRTYGLNGELSERTDLWAVGVIVYRMLTGRLPFGEGEQDLELVRDEITGKDPDYDKVPARYRGLLEKCLTKNAAERVGSAALLLAFLEGRASVSSRDDLPTIPGQVSISPHPTPDPPPVQGSTKEEKNGSSLKTWMIFIFCGLFLLGVLGIIGYEQGKTTDPVGPAKESLAVDLPYETGKTTDPVKKELELEKEYIGTRVEDDSIVNKFNNPWFKWEKGSKKLFEMFPTLIDIESNSVTLDPNSTQILTAELSWYPNGELIRFSDPNWNKKNLAIYYLLDRGGENLLVRLNGTSPPIHSFNSQTELMINERNAIDYAKFFGYFVRDKNHQPFFLLTSLSDPAIAHVDLSASLKDKFQVAKVIDGNDYNIDAYMLYQGSLFNVTLQVEKGGMVNMLNDEHIEDNSIFSLEVPVN